MIKKHHTNVCLVTFNSSCSSVRDWYVRRLKIVKRQIVLEISSSKCFYMKRASLYLFDLIVGINLRSIISAVPHFEVLSQRFLGSKKYKFTNFIALNPLCTTIHLLCIWTGFLMLRPPKSCSKYSFWLFHTFSSFQPVTSHNTIACMLPVSCST